MTRVVIIKNCKECPNRYKIDKMLARCMLTGEHLISVYEFPENCPLKTIEEFYVNLMKKEDESN